MYKQSTTVHIYSSTHPDVAAAQRVSVLLAEHKARDILLLLSGGSAFKVLDHIDTTLLSEKVTISVADERYTYDEASSNFSQLAKTAFFERTRKQHVQLIDPRPSEGEDLLDAAKRFDVALKYWHITHHDGIVLALLGIGADGHTAGMLPFPNNKETFEELFIANERCVRGYHVDARVNSHQDRMTVTATYLKRHVNYAVVYAAGKEKKAPLLALRDEECVLHVTPAHILQALPSVDIYTDQDL